MEVTASTEKNTEIFQDFREKLKLHLPDEKQASKQEQGENEEEFSFACASPHHSPVSTDEAFLDGQFRKIFPVFDQSLLYSSGDGDLRNDSKQSLRPPLRKLFVEETSEPEEEEPVGPFCEWLSGGDRTVKEASSEPCKKSNSTGFSKLWRFRGHVLRSNSDGKDAFVFLNNNNNSNDDYKNNTTCEGEKAEKSRGRHERSSQKPTGTKTVPAQKTSKGDKVVKVTGADNNITNKRVKAKTMSSVYEEYYTRNRVMQEGNKHRSYVPYRQDLVGLFINVNGFSRNVHPF